MARITFLLPVYNAQDYLQETLQSLLAQIHDDFDILVIDDGSTDDSGEIIAAQSSKKIRYHFQENAGLVRALNTGLKMIDSQFIARIDADDICAPDRLVRQQDFIEFSNADAISGRAIHIDELGHPIGLSGVSNVYDPDPDWLPPKEPYLSHPFMFARTDVLQDFGYRPAHLAEDADLCWRLSHKHRLAVQSTILGQYRLHPNSVSARDATAGRVQAFYAALAALNAKRRTSLRDEIPYNVSFDKAQNAAQTIEGLVALFSSQLEGNEASALQAGGCLKLLDLARWRGYKVTQDDIAAAKTALKQLKRSSHPIDENNIHEAGQLISMLQERLDHQDGKEPTKWARVKRKFQLG